MKFLHKGARGLTVTFITVVASGCYIENPDAIPDAGRTDAGSTDTSADTQNGSAGATDTDSDVDSDVGPDIDGDTDSVGTSDTLTPSGTETVSGTGSDADSEPSSEPATNANTSDSAGSDTGTDTGCDVSMCTASTYCNGEGDAVCLNDCGAEIVVEDCVSSSNHGNCEEGICGCMLGFEGEHCDVCVVTYSGQERCDEIDNDCDGAIDEGFDLSSDYTQCGGCNNNCLLDGSLWPDFGGEVPENTEMIKSEQGKCLVETCLPGFGDDALNAFMDCAVTVTQLEAGAEHNCALLSNGTVKCWGSNEYGQLGANTGSLSATPVAVTNLVDVEKLAVGYKHNCALTGAGEVYCWGSNKDGKLGTENVGIDEYSMFPVQVTGLANDDVIGIAVGGVHSCAMLSNGHMKCWGNNRYGALGSDTGSEMYSIDPLTVNEMEDIQLIDLGSDHTCAVSQGTASCWGLNFSGTLGPDSSGNTSIPVLVPTFDNVVKISLGGYFSCVVLDTVAGAGETHCWGYNAYGQIGADPIEIGGYDYNPRKVPNISQAEFLSSGWNHSCVIVQDGTVYCWGYNQYGQLGANTEDYYSYIPVASTGASGATAVSVGHDHTCALISDGTVKCWGWDQKGQIGDGEASDVSNHTAGIVVMLP